MFYPSYFSLFLEAFMLTIKDDEFIKLTTYIKREYGINLIHKRTLIEGRLSNIITEKGFDSFSDYLAFVFNDKTGQEITVLINKLTTNHTYFMREANHFDFFQNKVLPYFASHIGDNDLRVWSAGCSTGEEPYTLEMLIHDYFGSDKNKWNTDILATDISMRALNTAQKGEYPSEAMNEVPAFWKMNYFDKTAEGNFKVKDSIKKEIIFRKFNLMEKSFPFRRRFHTIFCRNVMIYFDQQTKTELVNRFYDFTEPGGYLFIGHSESINRDQTKYKYIMPAVYRKEL